MDSGEKTKWGHAVHDAVIVAVEAVQRKAREENLDLIVICELKVAIGPLNQAQEPEFSDTDFLKTCRISLDGLEDLQK